MQGGHPDSHGNDQHVGRESKAVGSLYLEWKFVIWNGSLLFQNFI